MSNYVKDAKRVLDEITGTDSAWSGLCLWIPSIERTSELAPTLLGLGCRWSAKRGQWYWRYVENAA